MIASLSMLSMAIAVPPSPFMGSATLGDLSLEAHLHGMEVALEMPFAGAYENPYKGACGAGEKNLTLTGLPGAICGPACSTTSPCPAAPAGATAQPKCAVDISPSKTPNACALICTPPGVGGCPTGATCKPIQGTGVCTYNNGPAPAPGPAPPSPPSPAGPHYADPSAGCTGGDQSVSITGLKGNCCAPKCNGQGSACPAPPAGVTAKGECVLEVKGSTTPNLCVLICKSNDAEKAMTMLASPFDLTCPPKATCKPIQTTAICTYDSLDGEDDAPAYV